MQTPTVGTATFSRQALKRGRKLRRPFRHRERMLKTFTDGAAVPDVPVRRRFQIVDVVIVAALRTGVGKSGSVI